MKKIAVVLMNLGGPDSPAAIAPFLKNFFMDPAIIGAPYPVRWLLSRYIAFKRSRAEAGSAYGALGGRSPLLPNTQRQADALAQALAGDPHTTYSVHVCMRYWHPFSHQVVRDVAATNPDQVILMPLYPQFSTTTTGSSFKDWQDAARAAGLHVPTYAIGCYYDQAGWIAAGVRSVRRAYDDLRHQHPDLKPPRILFSAHGLPEKIIRAGDPYQAQCEATAASIVQALGVPGLDWQICYQSRVGPLKWIGPSTDQAIHQAGRDQVPVVVYPHAFVSEHVETLVEIEQEYRHLAAEHGVPAFARAGTVMDDPDFIGGLAAMIRAVPLTPAPFVVHSANGSRRCGPDRTKCPCAQGTNHG